MSPAPKYSAGKVVLYLANLGAIIGFVNSLTRPGLFSHSPEEIFWTVVKSTLIWWLGYGVIWGMIFFLAKLAEKIKKPKTD
jgi:hypothetical protein